MEGIDIKPKYVCVLRELLKLLVSLSVTKLLIKVRWGIVMIPKNMLFFN